jgi:hypothetical protein
MADIATAQKAAVAQGQAGGVAEKAASASGAQAQQDINTQQSVLDLQKQADDANAGASFGTNPHAQSYMVGAVGDRLRASAQNMSDAASKLDQYAQTSPFKDFGDWISAMWNRPSAIRQYNGASFDFENQGKIIKGLAEATTEAGTSNSVVDATTSTLLLAAKNAKVLADAQGTQAEIEQRMAQAGLNGLTVRQANSMDQFNMAVSLNNAKNQVADIAIRQGTLDVQNAFRLSQEGQIALQEKLRSSVAADQQAAVDRLNAAGQTVGLPKMGFEDIKLMTEAQKGALIKLAASPTVGSGVLLPSPSDAMKTLDTLGVPMGPGMAMTQGAISRIMSGAKTTDNMGKPLQGVGLQDAQDTAIRSAAATELRNIPMSNGIYSPNTLAATLQIPALKNLPMAADLGPIADQAPQMKVDPNLVYSALAKRIQLGQDTPATAAAQMTTFFKGVAADTSDRGQMERFGLSRLTNYNAQIAVSGVLGMFSHNKAVDLTNQAAVEALFTRENVQRLLQRQQAQQNEKSSIGRGIMGTNPVIGSFVNKLGGRLSGQ